MANEEQVRRLRRGVEEWDDWRFELGGGLGVVIDLKEADFNGAHLRSAYLKAADLSNANLGSADLSGATLMDANLRRANLRGADLTSASLSEADLSEADLRGANLSRADLFHADLVGANLSGANLYGANLTRGDLNRADLISANLRGANLKTANFKGANLVHADLNGANLIGADLRDANLRNANLTHADLDGVNLIGSYLRGANLKTANLRDANLGHTALAAISLSSTKGLAEVVHHFPSTIGTDTLERTAQGLQEAPPEQLGEVEAFLRCAGVPELVMDVFQLMVESPIEFYSVFISYSHRDKPFARRLYEALQARGIRCWLDEHALLPGDDIADSIDHGIRIWDKVLLCCSEDSLRSYWVEAEVDKAVEKERQLREDRGRKVHAIIPLDLDGYLQKWQDGRASMIRKRLAADFTGWASDHSKFEAQLERVCEALRTERDPDPEPRL